MAASVEVEKGSDLGGLDHVALGIGFGDGLESTVQAVDVGLMVTLVVQLHNLATDVRLEGAIIVCERGMGVLVSVYCSGRVDRPARGL